MNDRHMYAWLWAIMITQSQILREQGEWVNIEEKYNEILSWPELESGSPVAHGVKRVMEEIGAGDYDL